MGRISARSGRKAKNPGVAAPLVSASCRGNFWWTSNCGCNFLPSSSHLGIRGNCWYDMGGRSHASACSSPSSHSWTCPSRTCPSGPSTPQILLSYSGLMDESSVNGGAPWNERTIFAVHERFHRLLSTFVQQHQILWVSRSRSLRLTPLP